MKHQQTRMIHRVLAVLAIFLIASVVIPVSQTHADEESLPPCYSASAVISVNPFVYRTACFVLGQTNPVCLDQWITNDECKQGYSAPSGSVGLTNYIGTCKFQYYGGAGCTAPLLTYNNTTGACQAMTGNHCDSGA